jgi:hypothetical protein
MYTYGESLENIQHDPTCMVGSSIEVHLFGSMEEDDYDKKWSDDSSAQGGHKENYIVGEDNSNMCKEIVMGT